MAQYIDKSALVAEIKRIKEMYCYGTRTNASFVAEAVINSINNAIDTLEVKEVDLDYIKNELDEVVRIYKPDGDFGWGTLYNVATHFFELGIKVAQKGEEV